MGRKRLWFLSLGFLVTITITLTGIVGSLPATQAQVPTTAPTAAPFNPLPSAPPNPPVPPIPPLVPSVPPQVPTTLPALPASTSPPLPLAGTYQDAAGRFKVGILQNYKVSPLAGAVLLEAPDGRLAYTVVSQALPVGSAIGFSPAYDSEALLKIATTVFQRGEGFQPGQVKPEAGGGVVIDWTGGLTIAGKTQPVSGVIIVRPTAKNILLLLIAATQTGANQVPNALSALGKTLVPL